MNIIIAVYESFPVDTRRRFNVYKTYIRRHRRRIDVLWTLKRRRVSTGLLISLMVIVLALIGFAFYRSY